MSQSRIPSSPICSGNSATAFPFHLGKYCVSCQSAASFRPKHISTMSGTYLRAQPSTAGRCLSSCRQCSLRSATLHLSSKPRLYRPRKRQVVQNGLFGLGLPEVAVIAGVAALIFGPSKLPEIGKGLGKTVKSFQVAAKEFEQELKAATTESGEEKKETDFLKADKDTADR